MLIRLVALLAVFGLVSVGAAAAPPTPRLLDDHGDPLPDGAVARLGTLRWRTGARVNSLAWSPDGKWIASAEECGKVRLWDSSGRVVRTFHGHRAWVGQVAFSPDGKRLLSICQESFQATHLNLWDVQTGARLRRLVLRPGHHEEVQAAFSTDGKTLTVLCNKEAVRYHVATGERVSRRSISDDAVLSPRGDRVAVGGREDVLEVIDTASGAVLWTFKFDPRFFEGESFSENAKFLCVVGGAKASKVWDVDTGKEVCSLPLGETWHEQPTFSPDGKTLLCQDEKHGLALWDVATGKKLQTYGRPSGRCRAFSPDGKRLVTCESDRLRIWDVAKATEIRSGEGMDGRCDALAFSPDSKFLLTGGHDPVVRLWNVRTRKVVRELSLGASREASQVAFSPNGKLMAAATLTFEKGGKPISTAIVWDTATGKQLHALPIPMSSWHSPPCALLFSRESDVLFAIGNSFDGVHRWDLKTGKSLARLTGLRSSFDLQLATDSKSLLVSADRGVYAFDLATGKLRLVGASSWKPAPSPDGKRVVYFPYGAVRLKEENDAKQSPPLVADFAGATAMRFSPDGRWMVTAGRSTAIVLWDAGVLRNPPVYRMTASEWDDCWDGLGFHSSCYNGMWGELLEAGRDDAVTRLRERLTQLARDLQRAERMLKVVRGNDEKAAAKAAAELPRLWPGVRPLIEKAQKGDIDADARLLLVVALSALTKEDVEDEVRRATRAVEVLHLIDTPKARALLDDLARGKMGSIWADAAKAKEKDRK